MPAPSAEHLAHCNRHILGLPLPQSMGLTIVEQSPGRVVTRATVTAAVTGGHGHLDGTALYGILDYSAFLTAATALGDDESAATHNAQFTLLDSAPEGATLELEGTLERRGRHVAFVSMRAAWITEAGSRPIAVASITKSVLPMAQRKRERVPPGESAQ